MRAWSPGRALHATLQSRPDPGREQRAMSKSRGNVVGIDERPIATASTPCDFSRCSPARRTRTFPGRPGIAGYPNPQTHLAPRTRHAAALRDHRRAARFTAEDAELRYSVHSKIMQVTEEIGDRMHVNTCVAAIMTLLNDFEAFATAHEHASTSAAFAEGLRALLLLLAPFAPHVTEELWERTGHAESIHSRPGRNDDSALARALIPFVVQVNGKCRGMVEAPPGSRKTVFERAKGVARSPRNSMARRCGRRSTCPTNC